MMCTIMYVMCVMCVNSHFHTRSPCVLCVSHQQATSLVGPKDVVPNTFVQVQAKYMTWFDFHKTEVRRDLNPKYTSEAIFHVSHARGCDALTVHTHTYICTHTRIRCM